jgi:hypothetical protein
LHDYAADTGKGMGEGNGMRTTVVSTGSGKGKKEGELRDSDSERNLIYQGANLGGGGHGGIFKTTEVKVTSV